MRATRTSQNAARSASRCPGALELWAACTMATICARAVSSPTRVASTRRVPVVFTEAPITSEPTAFATGRLSPVTMDSSISDWTVDDGAVHRDLCPGADQQDVSDDDVGRIDLDGIPVTQDDGLGGASSKSVRMASLAPPRARISNQWPSRTKAVRTAAAS